MALVRSAFTVGAMTMASRVLGFARDWLMALTLGAGMAADAFFVAFKLPNFFRRLFAEGAFSAAFVPYFSAICSQDEKAGQRFAQRVLSLFLPTLVLFVALVELAMPTVVYVLTGGFADGNAEKLALAIDLSRITFPFLGLISLVTLCAGVLNGLGKFAAAAAVPVLLNVSMISALLLAPENPSAVAVYVAAGVTLAGVIQLLFLLAMLYRAGMPLSLHWPTVSPNVIAMLKAMVPAAIGAGAVQINLLIDILLATRFLPEGSISYLYYGDRLVQLPIGVIGVAVGTALLPQLSRILTQGDQAAADKAQNQAIEMVLVITLPAMVALLCVPDIFIRILFEHGAFDAGDTAATVLALMAYAAGLPAYVLIKVFTPGFFARGDTKSPVRISIFCLMLNTGFGIALMGPFAHAGLALATALAAWVNASALAIMLINRSHLRIARDVLSRIARMALAALGMAGGLYGLATLAAPLLAQAPWVSLPSLIGVTLLAMILYGGLGMVFGAFRPAQLRRALTRRPRAG